jgi:hypothetical protein
MKAQCPLWVISGQTILGQNPTLSALVRKRTCRRSLALPANDPKWTRCHRRLDLKYAKTRWITRDYPALRGENLFCSITPSATTPLRTALSRDFAASKRAVFAAS